MLNNMKNFLKKIFRSEIPKAKPLDSQGLALSADLGAKLPSESHNQKTASFCAAFGELKLVRDSGSSDIPTNLSVFFRNKNRQSNYDNYQSGKNIKIGHNISDVIHNLISNLPVLNMGDINNFALFLKGKFNSIVTRPQAIVLGFGSFKLDYLGVFQRMIKPFQFCQRAKNTKARGFGYAESVFKNLGMDIYRQHEEINYAAFLASARAFSRRIHDFPRLASPIRRAVSLMIFGLDSSIRSIMSSKSFREIALAGAITPRMFLSSIMVSGDNLFIQLYVISRRSLLSRIS